MYDNENSSWTPDNDIDISSNGLDNGDMEGESSALSENRNEEDSEEISDETESESESELGESEDSSVDYTSILLSIDGRLENVELSLANIEANQLDIINNTEDTSFLVSNFQEGFTVFTIVILLSVICFVIYHWLDNFIK